MVRGKKKLGYDLKIELKTVSQNCEGMIRIMELCDDSDEPESFDCYCTKGKGTEMEEFLKALTSNKGQVVKLIKRSIENFC